MIPKRTITLLGSTGSIGVSTLSVLEQHPDKFEIFALSAYRQREKLAQQCLQFSPQYAQINEAEDAQWLAEYLREKGCATEVLHASESLCAIARDERVDIVVAAIVGAAGLLPTWAAAQAGKTILLANKETLVMAGGLFMNIAQHNQAKILPIDSEHNAIYQVLPKPFSGSLKENGIQSLILTASGGPFLNTPLSEFAQISPEMAVKHPNWSMGQKISVDSATMMNKGLEVIEAHWLFNAPTENIEVLIHPQSVIHSMVRYDDGSVLAQLGTPDMRTPIAYCLGLPERICSGVKSLDFTQMNALTFTQPDLAKFPCLSLAFQALKSGGDAPCVLNAANEIAVEAFLHKRIRFNDIAKVVEQTLQQTNLTTSDRIDDLLDKDQQSRRYAQEITAHFQAAI